MRAVVTVVRTKDIRKQEGRETVKLTLTCPQCCTPTAEEETFTDKKEGKYTKGTVFPPPPFLKQAFDRSSAFKAFCRKMDTMSKSFSPFCLAKLYF